MTEKFPYRCCRCGMCCLSMTCLVGQHAFGITEKELCHALVFKGDEAICKLAPDQVPVGDGCCIKARIYDRNGTEYDFASLPEKVKKQSSQQARQKAILLIAKGEIK